MSKWYSEQVGAISVRLPKHEKAALLRAVTKRSHELGRVVSINEFMRDMINNALATPAVAQQQQ